MKGNSGTVLLLGAAVVGVAAMMKHGDDVKTAITKLGFKVISVKLVPVQTSVTGVGSLKKIVKDVGNFFSNIFKEGKKVLTALTKDNLKVGLNVSMRVDNPTSTTVSAPDFSFVGQVLHQGKPLANINLAHAIKIDAHSWTNVTIPVVVNAGNVVSNLLDSLKGKGLNSIAEVTVKGSGYAMATPFPVDQKFNLLQGKGVAGIGAARSMPFTLKQLQRTFPDAEMGYRERDILFAKRAKLKYVQPGVYRVETKDSYFEFTYGHPNYKAFTITG